MRAKRIGGGLSRLGPILALLVSVGLPAHAEPLPQKVIDAVENFNRFLNAVEICGLTDTPVNLAASAGIEEGVRKARERLIAQGYNADVVRAFVTLDQKIRPAFDKETPAADVVAFCEGNSDWDRRIRLFEVDIAVDIDRAYPPPGGKDDAAVLDLISGASGPWMRAMTCDRLRPSVRESLAKIVAPEVEAASAELDRFDLSPVAKEDAKLQLAAMQVGFPLDSMSFDTLKSLCSPSERARWEADRQNPEKSPSAALKKLQPAK
jgi:hypothetical protein